MTTQIKIFMAPSTFDLEVMINQWLKEHSEVEVVHIGVNGADHYGHYIGNISYVTTK